MKFYSLFCKTTVILFVAALIFGLLPSFFTVLQEPLMRILGCNETTNIDTASFSAELSKEINKCTNQDNCQDYKSYKDGKKTMINNCFEFAVALFHHTTSKTKNHKCGVGTDIDKNLRKFQKTNSSVTFFFF
jgi:hypothetical protein